MSLQAAPAPADPAGCVAEALGQVGGWSWGIREAVAATDPASISRARIRDRCGGALAWCDVVIGRLDSVR